MFQQLQTVFQIFGLFASQKCPPDSIKYLDNLDLNAYIRNPWYVQMQQVVIYTPRDGMYCIRDHIYPEHPDQSLSNLWLATTWNQKSVDGALKTFKVHGHIKDMQTPSRMKVGPKLVPTFMRGEYWVVAASDRDHVNGYEWVIVSGGLPKKKGQNGKCKMGTGFNGSGLWLMTREPIVHQSVIDNMLQIVDNLGYDKSILEKVYHEGCTYPAI
ncbi:hypothetical protein MP228_008813 [Amoeboaphelidium protococcarum]|nr:hypothetical protein MP228_008813 [Amoeboaphelidium protococcarum]